MKEQYLNPDLMHMFIRDYCHKNGYLVLHFNFVQRYFNKRPCYLDNGELYNYGYEAIIFRLKERPVFSYGNDFVDLIELKCLYFDITTEHFHFEEVYFDTNDLGPLVWDYENLVFDDELAHTVNKVLWPKFISHNGICYYAIYHHPKVMLNHNLRDKMRYCLYEALYPSQYLTNNALKTQTEQWDYMKKAFQECLSSEPKFYFGENLPKNTEYKHSCFGDVKKHFANFNRLASYDTRVYDNPLFYTSNALELTIPIEERINKLENYVVQAVSSLQQQVSFLMNCVTNLYYRDFEQKIMITSLAIYLDGDFRKFHEWKQQDMIKQENDTLSMFYSALEYIKALPKPDYENQEKLFSFCNRLLDNKEHKKMLDFYTIEEMNKLLI